MERRPIRVVVTDDELRRARLTVAFRLLLAVPHLVWFALFTSAAFVLAFVVWLAVLFERRAPRTLHGFLAAYVRYTTHLAAYLTLAAAPYPGFTGSPGYPVDVELDPPASQRRLSAAFRLVLAVPALLIGAVLGSSVVWGGGYGALTYGGGIASTVSLLAWFACLARGRMPRGLRDLAVYCAGYGAQALGYVLLLAERYPDSRPGLVEPPPELPPHPVRLRLEDELRRSRLTVLLRLPLLVPHVVWFALWSAVVLPAALVAWVWALAAGALPGWLHRFLAAYVRYGAHVTAFGFLVGGPFPGFVGRQGSYPVEIEIDPPVRQRRLVTLARLILSVPALLLNSALSGLLYAAALLGWWYALVTGGMPRGLRDAGAAAIRYQAQVLSYLLLLTERYPYSAPALKGPPDEIALEEAA